MRRPRTHVNHNSGNFYYIFKFKLSRVFDEKVAFHILCACVCIHNTKINNNNNNKDTVYIHGHLDITYFKFAMFFFFSIVRNMRFKHYFLQNYLLIYFEYIFSMQPFFSIPLSISYRLNVYIKNVFILLRRTLYISRNYGRKYSLLLLIFERY